MLMTLSVQARRSPRQLHRAREHSTLRRRRLTQPRPAPDQTRQTHAPGRTALTLMLLLVVLVVIGCPSGAPLHSQQDVHHRARGRVAPQRPHRAAVVAGPRQRVQRRCRGSPHGVAWRHLLRGGGGGGADLAVPRRRPGRQDQHVADLEARQRLGAALEALQGEVHLMLGHGDNEGKQRVCC